MEFFSILNDVSLVSPRTFSQISHLVCILGPITPIALLHTENVTFSAWSGPWGSFWFLTGPYKNVANRLFMNFRNEPIWEWPILD